MNYQLVIRSTTGQSCLLNSHKSAFQIHVVRSGCFHTQNTNNSKNNSNLPYFSCNPPTSPDYFNPPQKNSLGYLWISLKQIPPQKNRRKKGKKKPAAACFTDASCFPKLITAPSTSLTCSAPVRRFCSRKPTCWSWSWGPKGGFGFWEGCLLMLLCFFFFWGGVALAVEKTAQFYILLQFYQAVAGEVLVARVKKEIDHRG